MAGDMWLDGAIIHAVVLGFLGIIGVLVTYVLYNDGDYEGSRESARISLIFFVLAALAFGLWPLYVPVLAIAAIYFLVQRAFFDD